MTNDQTQREWWVQGWLDLLNSYRFKKRLERARDYARQGNVLSFEFQGPKVVAQVRGREQPKYDVSLWLDPFSDEQWDYVIETLSQQAIFSAKLLAGEMPQNIQDVFTANGLSLFPFSLSEVRSHCSCPDKANPCKHIGAVYYILGDRFEEDPFVLFQLRGRSKEDILSALRQMRSAAGEASDSETSPIPQPPPPPSYPLQINQFWQYNEPLESSLVVIAPQGSETVLDVLGSIPPINEAENRSKGQDTQVVMQYLDGIYKNVSQQAVLSAMNVEGS
ncbi:SWIM zinc finger family protein [Microseira wollei]|uniref:Zinc finger SWIM domain-containing protein n=1 Tax=Microseira wollei NIES-4236 TaxID=2530354 RepID=A0AAV3XGM0_9CYAN|nr:SWIM zinc finger family protein [Microseira wollei]GET39614.1 zinc finger SWIM domain-containing protein [Microseira wollei NIES-4236]